MFCPQCGGTNEDTARFCSMCGLDLTEYKEKWGGAADQTTVPAGQAYQQQYQPHGQQQYQQHYPPSYQPPYGAGGYGGIPNVPSYMGWAIAVLILCFWPTGIAAVVYASQVGNRLALGDIAGARESSRKAKMWCWITFGIGIAAFVIAILVAVFASAVRFNVY